MISSSSCLKNNDQTANQTSSVTMNQDSIVEKYVYRCADTYDFNLPEYQSCLDSGLAIDSTVAYLWQQKAMPYFKQMKYSVGMQYLDKAVKYDEERWLSYRGFIKCIFQNDYKGAITDFEKCITQYGNSFEMDHTYSFYIGLSYLQLNKFELAEKVLQSTVDGAKRVFGKAHHLDVFYLAISKYELKKWNEAIPIFDEALNDYPNFSEAQYYKALCLIKLQKYKLAKEILELSQKNKAAGFSINEDNEVYERYPYQLY